MGETRSQGTGARWAPVVVALAATLAPARAPAGATFATFESGQVRPLALSPDGSRLFALQHAGRPARDLRRRRRRGSTHVDSVPVGLEPVAVAARSDGEVWVVNHLSDSVSIVDVGADAAARRPHAAGRRRAARHRLRRARPTPAAISGAPSSPRRAAARTFPLPAGRPDHAGHAARAGLGLRRDESRRHARRHAGDDHRAVRRHAARPGGDARRQHRLRGHLPLRQSDDQRGGGRGVQRRRRASGRAPSTASRCRAAWPVRQVPGGLPAPNANVESIPGPETGLIVKLNPASGLWEDQLGRNWTNAVRFDLPDRDVFRIDALANPPVEIGRLRARRHRAVQHGREPGNGKLYVSNTEAHNEVRFEGPGTNATTVRGHLHEARITVIDGARRAAAPPQQAHRRAAAGLPHGADAGRRQGRQPRHAARHGGVRAPARSTSPPSARAPSAASTAAALEDDTFTPERRRPHRR